MEIGAFLFLSDIITFSTSAGVTEDKKKENGCRQLSMYWVNLAAEPGTGNAWQILFAVVEKCSLNALGIPKSSVYNLFLNNNELIFKIRLLLLKFKTLLMADQVGLTSFLCSGTVFFCYNPFLCNGFHYLFYFRKNYICALTFYSVCIGWKSDAISLC